MEIIFHLSMSVPDNTDLDELLSIFLTDNAVEADQVTLETIEA